MGSLVLRREELESLLPHRDLALCVDTIVINPQLDEVYSFIELSVVNHFFRGHFENNPILPAHWQFEMTALTAGAFLLHKNSRIKGTTLITSLGDRQKFRKPITPPQKIKIEVSVRQVKEIRGSLFAKFNGRIFLHNGDLATEFHNIGATIAPQS